MEGHGTLAEYSLITNSDNAATLTGLDEQTLKQLYPANQAKIRSLFTSDDEMKDSQNEALLSVGTAANAWNSSLVWNITDENAFVDAAEYVTKMNKLSHYDQLSNIVLTKLDSLKIRCVNEYDDTFIVWKGQRWDHVSESTCEYGLVQGIKNFCQHMISEADTRIGVDNPSVSDDARTTKMFFNRLHRKIINEKYNNKFIRHLKNKFADKQWLVSEGELNKNSYVIPFSNCTVYLNFEEPVFGNGIPQHLIVTGFDFEVSTQFKEIDATFAGLLYSVHGGNEDKLYSGLGCISELLLYTSVSKKMALYYDQGGSGKSVLLDLLKKWLRGRVHAPGVGIFTAPPSKSTYSQLLYEKRFCTGGIVDEVCEENVSIKVANLKKHVSGERTIDVKRQGYDAFSITNHISYLGATNHVNLDNNSKSAKSRILIFTSRFTTSDDPERIVIPKIVRLLKQIDTTDNKHAFFHLMFHFARLPLYYPEKIQLDGAPDIVARDTTKALDCKEKTQSKRETKGRKNTKNDCCVSLEYAEIETILKKLQRDQHGIKLSSRDIGILKEIYNFEYIIQYEMTKLTRKIDAIKNQTKYTGQLAQDLGKFLKKESQHKIDELVKVTNAGNRRKFELICPDDNEIKPSHQDTSKLLCKIVMNHFLAENGYNNIQLNFNNRESIQELQKLLQTSNDVNFSMLSIKTGLDDNDNDFDEPEKDVRPMLSRHMVTRRDMIEADVKEIQKIQKKDLTWGSIYEKLGHNNQAEFDEYINPHPSLLAEKTMIVLEDLFEAGGNSISFTLISNIANVLQDLLDDCNIHDEKRDNETTAKTEKTEKKCIKKRHLDTTEDENDENNKFDETSVNINGGDNINPDQDHAKPPAAKKRKLNSATRSNELISNSTNFLSMNELSIASRNVTALAATISKEQSLLLYEGNAHSCFMKYPLPLNVIDKKYFLLHSSKSNRGQKAVTSDLEGKIYGIGYVDMQVTTKKEALKKDKNTEPAVKGSKNTQKFWWNFSKIFVCSKTDLVSHKGFTGMTASAATNTVRKNMMENKLLLKKVV